MDSTKETQRMNRILWAGAIFMSAVLVGMYVTDSRDKMIVVAESSSCLESTDPTWLHNLEQKLYLRDVPESHILDITTNALPEYKDKLLCLIRKKN